MSVARRYDDGGPRESAALRRRLVAATIFCVSSSAGVAAAEDKRIELGGFSGYQFGATVEGTSNLARVKASIASSPSYGATIDARLYSGGFATLSYTQQPTDVRVQSSLGFSEQYDLTVHYLQLGGLSEFRLPGTDRLRPTLGATIGATVFNADDPEYDFDEWRLSLLIEGGFKLRIVDQLGLRFRARLLTTFLFDSGALICGGQAGCVGAVSGTAIFQGELGGGAYLAF